MPDPRPAPEPLTVDDQAAHPPGQKDHIPSPLLTACRSCVNRATVA
jgi:hypothetical protein